MTEREQFAKKVKILVDTREKQNQHIIQYLHAQGTATEVRKLDFGDYSFEMDGKSFEHLAVVERKGCVDELYNNLMHDRERLEKEFYAAKCFSAHLELMVEGVSSEQELRQLCVPDKQMLMQGRRIQKIGAVVYGSVKAFESGCRYGIHTSYVQKQDAAERMLEIFYYCYRGYKAALRPLRKEHNHAG